MPSQLYSLRNIQVYALQWCKPGDHLAVTNDTTRWATDSDPAAKISFNPNAADLGKRGIVYCGVVISLSGTVSLVDATDWLVENQNGTVSIVTDEDFRQLHIVETATAVPEMPVSVPLVLTLADSVDMGESDGMGTVIPPVQTVVGDA